MAGLSGNDIYLVDNRRDEVIEASSQGIDEVRASVSWVLDTYVENLRLTGGADRDGTGNQFANRLEGNSGKNRLEGLDGNDFLDGGAKADVMLGGDGADQYVVDTVKDSVIERRGEGSDTVAASVSYTLPEHVEHLRLTGTDKLNGTGNRHTNRIDGNDANNVLDGGVSGSDSLVGGLGNDRYILQNSAGRVFEGVDAGFDTVEAAFSHTLADNVEVLILTGDLNTTGTGNDLPNRITGNGGSNRLDGKAGGDRMIGLAGDDRYVVDDDNDRVIEAAGEGQDRVETAFDYTLPDNVEDLTLTGSGSATGTGNTLNNVLAGNIANNLLDGKAGNDLLQGGSGDDTLNAGGGNDRLEGGVGADVMRGGAGNDVAFVDDVGDRVIESANGGDDKVFASVSYILGDNIEDLMLTGTSAIDAAGNAMGNRLEGNSAANVLDGKGGADVMIGQGGSDIYIVNNVRDVVIELLGQGTDEVRSSVSWTLDEDIEHLSLTGSNGNSATGNRLSNILNGNSGANEINGEAGNDTIDGAAGADTLTGGRGADVTTGGLGADHFRFVTALDSTTATGVDRITDFSLAQGDKIDLSAIDGNIERDGDQDLRFKGVAEFDKAGQIQVEFGTSITVVSVNLDSDFSDAEMSFVLDGSVDLRLNDFIL